ncbi:MAG: acetyl-CoA acyltransferase, partial [Micromonosporaceae bacterium]|nr:acetyl-CoA acyltransferase [Micromonosporaceae bacterium]
MRDAVIVGAVRTPVGRRRGTLSTIHPVDLSGHILTALADRIGLDPAEVEDVVWGCVSQVGEQSWNIGRNAVLAAGWPESVTAATIDRQCGSSQHAVHLAAAAVIAGQVDVAVAGGVESMSRVPMGSSALDQAPFGERIPSRYRGREGFADGSKSPFSQGVGAEMIAARWGLSRPQLDEFAVTSHARAAIATDNGEFTKELAPVAGLTADEGIRRDTSLDALAKLRTPFRADGVVTAGTASQISDGAAALAVTTSVWAAAHGLAPMARVHTAVVAGDDPIIMLTAPIPATAKALRRSGRSMDDI